MSDRLKIVGTLFLLLSAFMAFLYLARTETSRELESNEVASATEELLEEEQVPRRFQGQEALTELQESASPTPSESNESAPKEDPESSQTLVILLKIIDFNGLIWEDKEGLIDLTLTLESRVKLEEHLTFKEGRVSTEIPRDLAGLRIDKILVGDEKRPAILLNPADIVASDFLSGSITLRAKLPPRVHLHVVDANTKAELQSVQVFRPRETFYGLESPIDFASAQLMAEGKSPLAVDVIDHGTFSDYWVVAKGYAALCVHFAEKSEGDRVVEMERGGNLELKVEGDFEGIPPNLMTSLRLRAETKIRGGEERTISLPCPQAGIYSMQNLRPGLYLASLETGETWEKGFQVHEEEVAIEAGLTKELLFRVDTSILKSRLVSVSARVINAMESEGPHFGQAHVVAVGDNSKSLTPDSRAQLQPNPERDAELMFRDLKLAPGSYVAEIENQKFPFRVEDVGKADFVFSLEVLPTLILKIRFANQSDYIEGAHVSWSGGGGSGHARWDKERSAYLLMPPEGQIHLSVWVNKEMQLAQLEHKMDHLQREIEIALPQSFNLVLVCKDLVIPHDFSLPLLIRNAKGEKVQITGGTSDGNHISRNLPAPGRYEVEVTTPPKGYRSKEVVSFELKAGEKNKKVIYELIEEH